MNTTYFLENIMKRYTAFIKDDVEFETGDFWRKNPKRIFIFKANTKFPVRVYEARTKLLFDYSEILQQEVTIDNCFSFLSSIPQKVHHVERISEAEAEKIMEDNIRVILKMPELIASVTRLREMKKQQMKWSI